jgi:hypothetical protein
MNSNNETSHLQGWDILIADAKKKKKKKKKIKELEFSVETFIRNKRDGRAFSMNWLSDKPAGTDEHIVEWDWNEHVSRLETTRPFRLSALICLQSWKIATSSHLK